MFGSFISAIEAKRLCERSTVRSVERVLRSRLLSSLSASRRVCSLGSSVRLRVESFPPPMSSLVSSGEELTVAVVTPPRDWMSTSWSLGRAERVSAVADPAWGFLIVRVSRRG